VFVPPIGTEVKVGFEEGDPDRPVLVGCLYNPATLPPSDPRAKPGRFGVWGRPGTGKTVPAGGLVFEDVPDPEAVRLMSRGLLQLLAGGKFELNVAETAVAEAAKEFTIRVGKCSLTMTPEGLVVQVGKSSFKVTESEIRLLATAIHLN
jgi:type VI secretion system secreted protein VgrG